MTDGLVEPDNIIVDIEDMATYYKQRAYFAVQITLINYGPSAGAVVSVNGTLVGLPKFVDFQLSFYGQEYTGPSYFPTSLDARGAKGLTGQLTLQVNGKENSLIEILKEQRQFTVTYNYKVVSSGGKIEQHTSSSTFRPKNAGEQIRRARRVRFWRMPIETPCNLLKCDGFRALCRPFYRLSMHIGC